MTGEIGLIDGDILDRTKLDIAGELHNPVDHDKRISVRQNIENPADVDLALVGG